MFQKSKGFSEFQHSRKYKSSHEDVPEVEKIPILL